jgi:hypothetical protein
MGAGGGKIERAKKVKGLNIIHKFYKWEEIKFWIYLHKLS